MLAKALNMLLLLLNFPKPPLEKSALLRVLENFFNEMVLSIFLVDAA